MLYNSMTDPKFVFAESATVEESNQMRLLAAQAKHCWLQEGHPGWSVMQHDSQDFIAHLPQLLVSNTF